MNRKRVIWIISEGSPGHVSQSAGLARALANATPVQTRTLESRPRLKGFLRHLIRLLWMGKSGRPLPDAMLRGPLGLESTPAGESPDLIISSGGKSVFAARSLAVRHRAPFIFIGERKPYPPSWFHTVFTPSRLETRPNDVHIDLIPTKVTPETVGRAADSWTAKPSGTLWTLLIGGPSRSHHYDENDWQQLAAGITELARRENIRWLISTSRRTRLETEKLLQKLIPPDIIAEAVWWCHQPKKCLNAYLGAADVVWVTQDSVSMVTESVAAGKTTVVIHPRHTPFPATSFVPGYLDNLTHLNLISRRPFSKLTEPTDSLPNSGPSDPTALMAQKAIHRLGWNSPAPHQHTPKP